MKFEKWKIDRIFTERKVVSSIPDISNLQIAFRAYSTRELKQARLLFGTLRYPWLVRLGKWMLNVALFIHFPIAWILKPTIFKHFCGGETLAECDKSIEGLSAFGIGAIPDYSVEGNPEEHFMDAVRDELIAAIQYGAGDDRISFAVFKPSGLVRPALLELAGEGAIRGTAMQEEWERAKQRIHDVCSSAYRTGIAVMVDAEESWVQKAIDEIVLEMMRFFNKEKAVVYQTVQLYRTDGMARIKEWCRLADEEKFYTGFKLVRGAYMEKERKRAAALNIPSPIHADKQATDEAYNDALKYCVGRIERTSLLAGTHNEESTLLLCRIMQESKLEANDPRIHFSQLYGMSDHLSQNLAAAGYNVAKYLPYGKLRSVMPYLIRRAEENTSVAGQTGRELFLLKQELKRRKAEANS